MTCVSALLCCFSTAGTFNVAQEPSEEPSVTPSVLDGRQLQVPTWYFIGKWEWKIVLSDNFHFFFFRNFVIHQLWSSNPVDFCPCLSIKTGIITIIISFTVTVRMWWIWEFPVSNASFALKWIWICSWTLWFFYSPWWKHLVTDPKPVQLCLAAAARAGPPNTAHVSDIYEANWAQFGVLYMTWLFFLETSNWSQLRIYFEF